MRELRWSRGVSCYGLVAVVLGGWLGWEMRCQLSVAVVLAALVQMEGDAVEAVVADAEQLAGMLQPMYKELQVGTIGTAQHSLLPLASCSGPQHRMCRVLQQS